MFEKTSVNEFDYQSFWRKTYKHRKKVTVNLEISRGRQMPDVQCALWATMIYHFENKYTSFAQIGIISAKK